MLEIQHCRKHWHNHNRNNTQIVILVDKYNSGIAVYRPPLGISNRKHLLLREDAFTSLAVSISHHNINKKLLSAPLSWEPCYCGETLTPVLSVVHHTSTLEFFPQGYSSFRLPVTLFTISSSPMMASTVHEPGSTWAHKHINFQALSI